MNDGSLAALAAGLAELRQAVTAGAAARMREWAPLIERDAFDASAANLAAYLALRRHDLRPLQVDLMGAGLSSLGRLEGRVTANLDAVIWAVDRLSGEGYGGACRVRAVLRRPGEPGAQHRCRLRPEIVATSRANRRHLAERGRG